MIIEYSTDDNGIMTGRQIPEDEFMTEERYTEARQAFIDAVGRSHAVPALLTLANMTGELETPEDIYPYMTVWGKPAKGDNPYREAILTACRWYDEIMNQLTIEEIEQAAKRVKTFAQSKKKTKDLKDAKALFLGIAKPVRPRKVDVIAELHDPVTNAIFDGEAWDEEALVILKEGRIDKENQLIEPIQAAVRLAIDGLPEEVKKRLTEFDRTVMESTCSLWAAHNKVFSVDMLYRLVYKASAESKAGEKTAKALTESLDKLNGLRLHYTGASQHGEIIHLNAPLIAQKSVTAFSNGNFIGQAFALIDKPPLLHIAEQMGLITWHDNVQFIEAPRKIWQVAVRNRIDRAVSLSKGKKEFVRLSLQSLYEAAGAETKLQKQRTRAEAEAYLEALTKENLINNFKTYTSNDGRILGYRFASVC